MQIKIIDEFEKIVSNAVSISRTDNWTWHYLVNFRNFPKNNGAKYLDRNVMAEFIKANRLEQEVHNNAKQSLLPDSEFEWISNNERQLNWIKNHIGINEIIQLFGDSNAQSSQYKDWDILSLNTFTKVSRCISTVPGLDLRSLICLAIDLDLQHIHHKKSTVSKIKDQWMARMQRDKIFDFFADNNFEKFQILQYTLKKEFPDRGLPNLESPDQKDILVKFDSVEFSNLEIKTLVAKCRTTYNQKIRRSKPDAKRQCNLLLSESTILQLEKLARNHGFSRSEVIEILVKNEKKHEIYLKERVELKKRLLLDNQDKSEIFI